MGNLCGLEFKQQAQLESHNFVAGSGLKASTATPSSPILRQSSRSSWLWLNWFFRSILLILFILEDNLPFLVFKKGIVTISLIRCKILLQSSFTFMHRKTFCHTSKYLILLLPWFLMIRTTCVFNLNRSLGTYVIPQSLITRSSLKFLHIFLMASLSKNTAISVNRASENV